MTGIAITRDPVDPVTGSGSVTLALDRLRATLEARGTAVRLLDRSSPLPEDVQLVLLAGPDDPIARARVEAGHPGGVDAAESFALVPGRQPGEPWLLLVGADVRGLVYAILEIADRVEHAPDPHAGLTEDAELHRPANRVRSVARLFCSELEDKPWFHDEAFWDRYLGMLIAQRFNRCSLTLGLGYNYPRNVTDAYLYFAYPFLLEVPGYDVRVPQLSDQERDRNLAMLRYASERATALGLDFQLGLWTHAFEWIESPDAQHTVEGLSADRHAEYCRDAIRCLLEACPAIGGITLRIHGESGIPERSWDFWRAVFEGVAACGREVGLDLHAKGLDRRTLDAASEMGLSITVSPKFWAEHMGLPYHQAAIRERERLPRDDPSHLSDWHRAMRVSEGSRPFTRYGYGDFLREDRRYGVVFRLWAGSQRVLLWGDPAFAAGYGRVASIADAQGLEWCEPLTFKGREGTGREGSRTGYADPSLVPSDDWEKYAYTYRLFGRLTYDPETPAEAWRRPLRSRFGDAASDAEAALSNASRILPLVTVAHHPSASNNYYWPEVYTDMPIVWTEDGTRQHPYLDTPTPRRFGTVDPLDPEVFSSVADYVTELADEPSGRVTPVDVAGWLEGLAEEATRHLASVADLVERPDAELRRWSADISIQAALGRFFAGKLRAAVAYEAYSRNGDDRDLRRAVDHDREARNAWAEAAAHARGVYVDDLTFGPQPWLRGHWTDRLAAVDADLADMAGRLQAMRVEDDPEAHRAFTIGARSSRPTGIDHDPPDGFIPHEPLRLELLVSDDAAASVGDATVRFRPMDQARPWMASPMARSAGGFEAAISGADAAYPLAYAFVVRTRDGGAWRFPDLGEDLSAQPYFVVRPEPMAGSSGSEAP